MNNERRPRNLGVEVAGGLFLAILECGAATWLFLWLRKGEGSMGLLLLAQVLPVALSALVALLRRATGWAMGLMIGWALVFLLTAGCFSFWFELLW